VLGAAGACSWSWCCLLQLEDIAAESIAKIKIVPFKFDGIIFKDISLGTAYYFSLVQTHLLSTKSMYCTCRSVHYTIGLAMVWLYFCTTCNYGFTSSTPIESLRAAALIAGTGYSFPHTISFSGGGGSGATVAYHSIVVIIWSFFKFCCWCCLCHWCWSQCWCCWHVLRLLASCYFSLLLFLLQLQLLAACCLLLLLVVVQFLLLDAAGASASCLLLVLKRMLAAAQACAACALCLCC
jgi:hypothetical protein